MTSEDSEVVVRVRVRVRVRTSEDSEVLLHYKLAKAGMFCPFL